MGEFIFLSNYVKDSERITDITGYLLSQKIQYYIGEPLEVSEGLESELVGIYIILPTTYETINDIFDRREFIKNIPIHRRFIMTYEEEFRPKIDKFLSILSNKKSIQSFNYTKSKGILMLITEVDDKVGCIPADVLLKLNKSFDTLTYSLDMDRVTQICNIFGCDVDELTHILSDGLWTKFGIDIYNL